MGRENIFDEEFIALLKKGDVSSYHRLYNAVAPGMRLVCLRYVKDKADAEDVFHEGFIKVFSKIHTLKSSSLFVGWMKRIFINSAIDYYKKKKAFNPECIDDVIENKISSDLNEEDEISVITPGEIDYAVIQTVDFSEDDLLSALGTIPEHFKLVFQLFVIDGFKHREIAEMLQINEKTSKTRLLRARALIKVELQKLAEIKLKNG
jgi:RNA polymerase sigma-70 factor, ECF subfamily